MRGLEVGIRSNGMNECHAQPHAAGISFVDRAHVAGYPGWRTGGAGRGAARCASAALRRQLAVAASSSVAGLCSRGWLCVYLPVAGMGI